MIEAEVARIIAAAEGRLDANTYDNDRDLIDRQNEAMRTLVPNIEDLVFGLPDDGAVPPQARLPEAVLHANPSYSYADAYKGLAASAQSIAALYRRTNQSRYSRLMDVVLLETARIVQQHLTQSAAAYQALTARITQSAGDLRQAYTNAKELAANLNLAASILSAFGGLIAAV